MRLSRVFGGCILLMALGCYGDDPPTPPNPTPEALEQRTGELAAGTTLRDDVYIVSRGSTGNALDVLDNDSGGGLTLTAVTSPGGGAVVTIRNGKVFYTPDPNFNGSQTFTYTVNDGTGTGTASVTVTVPSFCTGASNLLAFDVGMEWISDDSEGADRGSAVVGDLDGDGTTEIIIEQGSDHNSSPRLNIFNGDGFDGAEPVSTINVTSMKMGNIALADVDGNGKLEVIFFDNNRRPNVYTGYNGPGSTMTRMVRSSDAARNQGNARVGIGPAPLHVADINQDGRPEILSGAQVWAFTGNFGQASLDLVMVASSSSEAALSSSFAASSSLDPTGGQPARSRARRHTERRLRGSAMGSSGSERSPRLLGPRRRISTDRSVARTLCRAGQGSLIW